jgi:hypothetical protein
MIPFNCSYRNKNEKGICFCKDAAIDERCVCSGHYNKNYITMMKIMTIITVMKIMILMTIMNKNNNLQHMAH